MTHYPTHERRAFLDWLESGCPDVATIEEHYEQREISADELLRRFMLPEGCTDVMPGHACEQVAGMIGDGDRDVRGMTYVLAASVLLVWRAADDTAAQRYLDKVLAGSALES